MVDLSNYPLLPIFLVSSIIILAAGEIGRRLGVRIAKRRGEDASTLAGAILGLLALMIGFTFAMAVSRFEGRRDAVLNEANAIRTTAMRARLLPEPHGAQALELLKEYIYIRLDTTQRIPSLRELEGAVARSNALQEALWQKAQAVAANYPGLVPFSFIQTLNEMINDHEKTLNAERNRVPAIALIALYAVATVAMAYVGYASGLKAQHSRLPVYITGILVSSLILLIQDLDRPTTGFITVSQQPMIDTAARITSYTDP
jgi:uncharacterized membrane protein YidH (DUF202 family)